MKKILLLVFLLPAQIFAAWSVARKITVKHQVALSGDLANYPLLVCFNSTGANNCANTGNDFKVTGSGGTITSASGYDIVIASDPTCSTILAFDRDYWVSTTGEGWFWVKTTLPKTVDASLYLCGGNSSIVTEQATPHTVWSDYAAVYHLTPITLGGNMVNTADSTSNGNLLDVVNVTCSSGTGIIGSGFVGSGACWNSHPNATGLPTGSSASTFSYWFKRTSDQAHRVAFAWGNTANANEGRSSVVVSPGYFNSDTQDVTFETGFHACEAHIGFDTNWHIIQVTYPSGGGINASVIRQDSSILTSNCNGDSIVPATGSPAEIAIGNYRDSFGTAGYPWLGDIDELRIAGSVLSNDTLNSDFTCQSNPSNCMAIGPNFIGARHRGQVI